MNDGDSVRGAEQNGQAACDGRANVGALLRALRVRLGEDLGSVADALCINRRYIEAIEAGRIKDLPGAAYAIGFIRAYSQHLGLDSQEVVRRFKAESSCVGDKTKLDFPRPIIETGIPGGAVVFVGVAIAVIAYTGWYVSAAKDNFFFDLIAPLPERIAQFATDARSFGSTADDSSQPSPGSATAATGPEMPPASLASRPAPTPASASAESGTVVGTAPKEPPPKAVQVATAPIIPAPAPVNAGSDSTPTVAPPEPTGQASPPPMPVSEPVAAPKPQPDKPKPDSPAVASPEPASVVPVVAAGAPEPPSPSSAPEAARKTPEPAREPARTQTPPLNSVPDATPSASANAQTAAAPAPRAYGGNESGSRILITAKGNSWIQVRDDNANEMLLTRLLRAGDSYRVPDRSGLKLLTGDAGALEIRVDGQPVPSVGHSSSGRRNIVLDAERLRAGTATAD